MNSYSKIPRAWWPKIAEEYASGMSGPKLSKKYGVGSTRIIYLILEKVRRKQVQTLIRALALS
jgi:Mor family transcriptional regulator